MSDAQVAAPLRAQAESQRKRGQLDTSGGPPPKKSIVTRTWWAIKSLIPPWGRSMEDEGRVVTVHVDEEERDEEGEEVEDEEEEVELVDEEEEQEDEVEIVEEEEEEDDIVPLPLLGQSPNLHRVPEVVTMGGSTDEEEQVIRREVREEEVLVIETPEKTTVYTHIISPPSLATTVSVAHPAPVVAQDDSDDEVRSSDYRLPTVILPSLHVVEVLPTTPSGTSSRVFSTFSSSSHPHHPLLTGLSPEVTTRVMEYVTEQSSRMVTAHSPSQSSTNSFDREKLRVEEEEDRGDSPLPEDSASRQVTPKSAIGGERSGYTGTKRDTWRKNHKRERDPFRLVGRSRVIGKDSSSNLTRKTTEKLRSMNHQRQGERNPFDDDAKQRYKEIMDAIEKKNSEKGAMKPALPFKFTSADLNTRQKLGLEDHKKRLAVGKQMALDVLDDMFPRGRGAETIQEVDNEVAGPSRDTTIVLDESISSSRDYSIRSPNASLSFHSVDTLSNLQSKIQEMHLVSTRGVLQYDLYKGSKADFDRTVERLGEEGDLRTAHRLEVEKQHYIDVRTKLALQGIVIPEPEKVVDEFPELSDEAEALWRRAWVRGVETEKFRDGDPPLTRKDLITLNGLNWLNDEIILAYLNLIVDRSKNDKNLPSTYAFNTFFYGNISNPSKGFATVKRWTRKVDIFAHDILLIPVHLSVHWTMAVVDVPAKTIHFYDSMDRNGGHREVAERIMKYLVDESMDKRKISLDPSEWERLSRTDIPQQCNGSDCGVFACKFADFAARRAEIVFDQSHMPYYRKRMVYQLCQNDLAAF